MTQHAVRIADRSVGGGAPALLIGEVGLGHDGSLGLAHAYVDAIADAGADAVKFQTHIAEAESTLDEEFRISFSRQDATRYDYWSRTSFTEEQWCGLAQHARERGLVFLSSAFSIEAVELLERVGVPAWKVGSGEFRSVDLLRAMALTGKPVLLSTGMSRLSEIDAGVAIVQGTGGRVVLMQCTSRYPAPFDAVGLNVLDELRVRHNVPVGLSDHTGSVWPAVAAIARGADIIEAHVVFDRAMFGPDVQASLTLDQMRQLVEARNAVHAMLASPVDKDVVAAELESMRNLFTKSLAPVADLEAGTVLEAAMVTSKKPGSGIPLERISEVVGRRLRRSVSRLRLLRWEDLDD